MPLWKRQRLPYAFAGPRRLKRGGKSVSMDTKKYVQSAIRRGKETKDFTIAADSTSDEVSSTFSITSLSAIPEGTGDDERIATRVKPSFYQLRGFVQRKTTSTTGDTCRILIVQNLANSSGTVPTAGGLFEDTTLPFMSPIKYENCRFKVLYDRVFNLASYSATANPLQWRKLIKINIPGKRFNSISFNDDATTGIGKIYLCKVSERATGTAASEMYYYSRLRYKE